MKHQDVVLRKGKFQLEEETYDYVEDHRDKGGGSGSEWNVLHEELDVSGNTKKEKRLYSSYQYALMNIGQQFKIDFNKYKDHLSADEQKKVMNSFMDSLNDEMARHPHYVIKGTYFDKNGKTCFFEAKAEIEGYMVRSQSTEPDKVKINLKDQIKNKEKPKGLKKKFGFPFYPKHKDDDRDFDNCR